MAKTITSANAVLMLGIAGLFPVPQQISGFGVDDAFETDAVDAAVVQLGVDGRAAAGYIPRDVPMGITLLASSESFPFFDNWVGAQDTAGEILYATGTIVIPSIARKYTMFKGALTRYPTIPSAKRVLMQRTFQITWMPDGPTSPAITASPT